MPAKLPMLAIVLLLSSVFLVSRSWAAHSPVDPDYQQIVQRIDSLQHQINTLKAELKQRRRQKSKPVVVAKQAHCQRGDCRHSQSRISIGPYLNKDRLYDGSTLITNVDDIREASRLLLRQAKVAQDCQQTGIPLPDYPRLTFSGYLEGLVSWSNPYAGSSINNIDFSGAELSAYVEASPWIHGYMALDYDFDETINRSRVFMNRAFITIGNLTQLPLYLVVGQIYVPFGRYDSAFSTSPLPKSLARTRARTLMLGWQQRGDNAFHAEVYGFQGLTRNVNKHNTTNEGGIDVGYRFKSRRLSGYLGGSVISNIADSQGFQATVFSPHQILNYRVPAYDIYGSIALAPVVLIAEYVKATTHFNLTDVAFANHGARPSAYNIELDYTFHTGSKPSSIGVAYQASQQALALELPKYRYAAVYNVNIWRNTNLAIEYRHDVNYPANTATTDPLNPTLPSVAADLGKSDNVTTAQFDLYF